jgi:hypothetical protein
MFRRVLSITLLSIMATFLTVTAIGCEGASRLDQETRDKLDAKLTEWNENGTFPIPETDIKTEGYLKSWKFKYNRLYLVFNSRNAHPVNSRSVMETVAVEWYNTYPANIKPRFILQVFAYIDEQAHENEWGMTKIKKGGTPETHWYATDVY